MTRLRETCVPDAHPMSLRRRDDATFRLAAQDELRDEFGGEVPFFLSVYRDALCLSPSERAAHHYYGVMLPRARARRAEAARSAAQ